MVTVMNVVQVDADRQEAFERDGAGEYIVSSRWENEEAFKAWLQSDSFKQSHRHADGGLAHGNEVRRYTVVDSQVPA